MHVSVVGLSKAYFFTKALVDVSLAVEPGRILAILGANGAGKSTLLRCLAGLVAADSGEIRYDGEEFNRRRVDLRRRFHFLPDAPVFFTSYNVLRQISLVLESYGKNGDADIERVCRLLAEFDLSDVEHLCVGELSRGQIYKVSLVALLAIEPDLWLLDEPFASGMDPHAIMAFRRHARQAAERGRTIVYSTQVLSLAESFSDEVCILHDGQVHTYGNVDALRSESHSDDSVLESIFRRLRESDEESA